MKTFREHLRQSWTYLMLSVAFMLFATASFAQNATVKGSISDSMGPMIGASVSVDGTQIGTVTELDGTFTLPNVPTDGTLTFSFIGYKSQSLPYVANKTYNVILEEDLTSLDEVIVVGYEVKKKSVVTGAIGGIDAEDLSKSKSTNAVSALSGRVSGVNVMTSSGQPGTTPDLIIRGVGTNGDSSPLYVVDGLQMSDLATINPNDIESMEVLKDATSTAIYGARGANGVVLVTTKKGKEGRTSLTYDGYYGVQTARYMPELLNSEEWVDYTTTAHYNSYDAESAALILSTVCLDTSVNTDWLDVITDPAAIQQHNITISTATEKTSSIVSFGYLDQYGVIGGNNADVGNDKSHYTRYTLRLNSSYKVTDYLTAGANVNLAYIKSGSISTAPNYNNPYKDGLYMEPTVPVYGYNADDQGFSTTTTGSPKGSNPVSGLYSYSEADNNRTNISANMWLDIQPTKDLTFRSSMTGTLNNVYNRSFSPAYYHTTNQNRASNELTNTSNLSIGWQWENTALYRKSLGEHNFSLLMGQSALQSDYQYFTAYRSDLADESTTNENYRYLDAGDVSTSTNEGAASATHTMTSYFARLSYNYKEKYMVEGVVRRDASSNFGPENKWGTFPGASVGWNVHNEDFWDVEAINALKVRASWGQNGNESIDPFSYTSMMTTQYNYPFGDEYLYGTTTDSTVNEDVKWETSEQIDFGVDLSFFGGKLTATADWYKKTTKDLLFQTTVSAVQGSNSTAYYNIGQVSNKGFEFMVSYRDNIGDLNYNVSVNMSTLKNNTDFINNEIGYITGGNDTNLTYDLTRMEAGHEIGYFYLFKTDGIFQSQEEIDAYINENGDMYQPDAVPGDYKWVDVDGDGDVDDDDRTDCGSGWAKMTYGASLNLDYKGFDFSVQLVAKTGLKVYPGHLSPQAIGVNNSIKAIADRMWSETNTSGKYARLTTSAGDTNDNWTKPADVMLENGNFLNINVMELGYSLPTNLLNKLQLTQVRVYVAVDNPFMFKSYYGSTPELSSQSSTADILSTGIDYLTYPSSRTSRVGLTVTF